MQIIQSTLPLYKFTIHIQATSPISFYNFPGIALRGGFGWMLKLQTCLEKDRTSCKGCQFILHCPYASIFESHNVGDIEVMKEATNFPHPFVMSPLVQWPSTIKPGESFTVYLSIFGEAIKYFHFFVKALKALGQRGLGKEKSKFVVTEITNYHNGDKLYTANEGYVGENIEGLYINHDVVTGLQINFLTPCHIKYNGAIITEPTLNVIIKNILRRYKIISNIYGDSSVIYTEDDINYDSIKVVDVHTEWYSTDRLSKRQNRIMKIEGFTGSMNVQGDISALYNILKIGEAIHLGKHTSFGCGLMKVNSLN